MLVSRLHRAPRWVYCLIGKANHNGCYTRYWANEMKVVILAGGVGTRLSEATQLLPKPLVEVGDRPIIWHIMKMYAAAGFDEFVVCCGYKSHMLKSYFFNYFVENYDITVHLGGTGSIFTAMLQRALDRDPSQHRGHHDDGGRIKRIAPYVGNETFCLTYGDGVSDVNICALVDFHRSQVSFGDCDRRSVTGSVRDP